jgi:hypothetical protein
MKQKALALIVAAAVALPAMAWAQAKTDFSGTWTFDESKSDPAPPGRGGGGGGGGRGGGGTPSKLMIKQTAGDITIERTLANGAQMIVYKLDASESVNKMGMGELKSKSSWDGAKLVVAGTQSIQTQNGNFDIATKEVYSLEGGALVVTTTRTTPNGDQTRKLVFNKG